MSHFNVAVFSKYEAQIDELLAPYNEVVEAGSPFAVFRENKDAELDETTGKRGYWYNPNARWDWYCVGGRWSGQLKLLPGRNGEYGQEYNLDKDHQPAPNRCDIARVRDCDFSPNEEAYRLALRAWEIAVDGSPMTEEEKKKYLLLYKGEYYIQQYGTRERYAKLMSDFSTYAFITADGEWHETGRMGWWGVDDATKESRDAYMTAFEAYLRTAKEQDLFITIVDCHI